jgi:hypothetical protein
VGHETIYEYEPVERNAERSADRSRLDR